MPTWTAEEVRLRHQVLWELSWLVSGRGKIQIQESTWPKSRVTGPPAILEVFRAVGPVRVNSIVKSPKPGNRREQQGGGQSPTLSWADPCLTLGMSPTHTPHPCPDMRLKVLTGYAWHTAGAW